MTTGSGVVPAPRPSSPALEGAPGAVAVIEDPATAAVALHPLRARILELLREPDSAAGVARALGMPRQRVTYHVRELERAGLLERVADRRKGNCVERVVRATACSYVIAPAGPGGPDAAEVRDRFSSAYLLASAAQALRDVSRLRRHANVAGEKLPTLSLQTEVRFANAAAQQAFAEELSRLVSKYDDAEAASGRTFRFTILGYPRPAGPAAGSG